jgi:hypothetical protein
MEWYSRGPSIRIVKKGLRTAVTPGMLPINMCPISDLGKAGIKKMGIGSLWRTNPVKAF